VFAVLWLTWTTPTEPVAVLLPPTWTTPPDCDVPLPPVLPTVAWVVETGPATGVSATADVGSTVTGPTCTTPTDWLELFPLLVGAGFGVPGLGSGLGGSCACATAVVRTNAATARSRTRE